MKKINLLLIGAISLLLFSCINEEGEGGTSVVHGKVYKILHPKNEFSFQIGNVVEESDSFKVESLSFDGDTIPAAKEKIYIVYGNQPIYGDRMDAGDNGGYRFEYLVKGDYTIYAFTSHTNSLNDAVKEQVTVKRGETVEVPDIYIHDGKAYESSYIKGTLHIRYYDKNKVTTKLGGGERMYIQKVGADFHFDDVRTGNDGVFVFQGLEPGDYEVFTYTQEDGYKINSIINDATRTCLQVVHVPDRDQLITIKQPFKITINS